MGGESDRELIDRARSGDAEAFGLLVRRHQKRIFKVALHLTKNSAEAEDITQDAFARAYQALGRFDGRSEVFTWLYRIAVNLSLSHLRAKRNQGHHSLEDDARASFLESALGALSQARKSADGGQDDRRIAEALYEGIDALSETLRTTLLLVCVDELSHDEVAKVLGCAEGTVAWRVHEARKKLRARLTELGLAEGLPL